MSEQRMKTVRLREGVYASGRTVTDEAGPGRVVHLVDTRCDLDTPAGVTVCCGAQFEPGTLEEVAWGEQWPHENCVRRSPWTRRVLEDAFRATDDELARLEDDQAEVDACVAVAEEIMTARSDWVEHEEYPPYWEYTASFNGVLVGDRRYPRHRDLGLEVLTAHVVKPGVFRIHSCGVRDGCSVHTTRTETFSLDEVDVIEERLTVHEYMADSIDLQALAWCLLVGACARTDTDSMF
jgi:hypothetical protein